MHPFRGSPSAHRAYQGVLALLVAMFFITACDQPSGASVPLLVGQRRLLEVHEMDDICVSPHQICTVARLTRRLAILTPVAVGSGVISVRGSHGTTDVRIEIMPAPGGVERAVVESPEPRPVPFTAVRPKKPKELPLPPPAVARPPTFPQLLGTCAEEAGSRALFSSKDARAGDRVGGFTVEEVLEDGVRLAWSGRRFFVPVNGVAREEVPVTGLALDGPEDGRLEATSLAAPPVAP
jgi:hypothetical protein